MPIFMKISTHERILAESIAKERSDALADKAKLHPEIAGLKNSLSAEQSISDSLRTDIAEMQVVYDRGMRRQAADEKYQAKKKAARAAKVAK